MKTILIVEDDPDLVNALGEMLQEEGFAAVPASRVADALYKLGNQRFDCILIDLRLGNGSGLKVVQAVRNETTKESLNFTTPIILMSGALDPEVVKTAAKQVQAILAKPFDSEILINKIRELSSAPRPPRL